MLSRTLAEQGHYPAIDVEASISRVMPAIVSPEHLATAQFFKRIYSRYQQNRDLISVGAYTMGSDPDTDFAIERMPHLLQFLRQGLNEKVVLPDATLRLQRAINPAKDGQGQPAGDQRHPGPAQTLGGSDRSPANATANG